MLAGKGGKNRRKGKNSAFHQKRDIIYKEDLQGMASCMHDPLINLIYESVFAMMAYL